MGSDLLMCLQPAVRRSCALLTGMSPRPSSPRMAQDLFPQCLEVQGQCVDVHREKEGPRREMDICRMTLRSGPFLNGMVCSATVARESLCPSSSLQKSLQLLRGSSWPLSQIHGSKHDSILDGGLKHPASDPDRTSKAKNFPPEQIQTSDTTDQIKSLKISLCSSLYYLPVKSKHV